MAEAGRVVSAELASVLLAHQHPIVCLGIRAILATNRNYMVVEQTARASEVVPLVERLHPSVLLIDAEMLGGNGADTLQQVLRCSSRTRVIVLARHADENYAARILRSGAAGVVVPCVAANTLADALRETAAGHGYMSAPLRERVAFDQADSGPVGSYDTLTPREREVLHLSAAGYIARTIGRRLGVSPRTVEKHRANLSAKLGVRTPADLVRYALRRGIVESPLQMETAARLL